MCTVTLLYAHSTPFAPDDTLIVHECCDDTSQNSAEFRSALCEACLLTDQAEQLKAY